MPMQEKNPLKSSINLKRKHRLLKKAIKIIPLGGLCEVGRNMTAIEYNDEIIVVDIGISFPDGSQPGIDHIIPNFNYIIQNKHKLKAVFITHGHEDHIGAVSYFVEALSCTVYAPPLALALINLKLEEKRLNKRARLFEVRSGDVIKLGSFEVEYIHVNHSIADSNALAIKTELGTILHTGDFKVDYTPINGGPIDLPRLASLGREGVLLLLCESTNIEKPGFSMSESTVGQCFIDAFNKAKGRIIVATFSSNVHRVQQIITAAEKNGRKVALIGRSMQNVFKAAAKLSYIKYSPSTIIDIDQVRNYPDHEVTIITTGSQGEPMAALTRMAFSDHRQIDIRENDTIIISSTPIPGNEKPIYRVINELYKKKANVIYSDMAEVHVSGHAYREEIKLMHQLIRPKYFMPVHGEYRMLYEHGKVANELGQPWDTIFIMNNGDILQITDKEAYIADFFECEPVLIDGKSATSLDSTVLNDRITMAEEGIFIVSLCLDKYGSNLLAEPSYQTKGFAYSHDIAEILREVSRFINTFVDKVNEKNKDLSQALRSQFFKEKLKELLFKVAARRPIVIVSVIEIEI